MRKIGHFQGFQTSKNGLLRAGFSLPKSEIHPGFSPLSGAKSRLCGSVVHIIYKIARNHVIYIVGPSRRSRHNKILYVTPSGSQKQQLKPNVIERSDCYFMLHPAPNDPLPQPLFQPSSFFCITHGHSLATFSQHSGRLFAIWMACNLVG